jgi:cytochrome o ubiquinol oxidase subunit I
VARIEAEHQKALRLAGVATGGARVESFERV